MPNPNFPNNPGYNLYVGARYVPVFAKPIEWNKANTYEPLTVVTYQGNSFTSKTFVPANTEITNTTYWALTGNYNAQVEQYRQDVENLDSAITEIQNANKKSGYYDFSNVLCYGDSFTEGYGLNNPATENWASQFMSVVNGGTLERYYNGAAGFVALGNTSKKNYQDDFDSNVWPVVSARASSFTTIIVQGGLNDGNQAISTEQAAVTSFINYLKGKFPNAKLLFLTCNYYQNPYSGSIMGVNLACREAGIGYTHHGWTALYGMTDYMQDDLLHPNANGCKMLAGYLAKCVLSGEVAHTNMTYHESAVGTGGITYRQNETGILISGEIDLTGVDAAQSITIDSNVPVWARSSLYQALPMYSDSNNNPMLVLNGSTLSIYFVSGAPTSNGKNRFSAMVAIPFR